MSRVAAAFAASVVLLAGCSVPPGQVRPSAPVTDAGPAAPSTVREPMVLATDLDVPWDLAPLPGGAVLVTLRDRAVVVRVADGAVETVATVPDVVPGGEGGLLGIALSPGFAEDGHVFLYYTAAQDNRVVRFRYTGQGLVDPLPILTGIPRAGNHNGGRLRFGPDGNLYVGTGDAGRPELAQDRSSLAGKILRVAPDGSIPAGNPFGSPVYSYGHRNVQGLGWDGAGRMFASEFGQNAWDELNLVTAGADHGWPRVEGATDAPGVAAPLVVWRTSEASPSGIAVTPDGTVYVAALRGERVWRVRTATDNPRAEVFLEGLGRVRDVALRDDHLLVLTNNTARGTPRPGDDRLLAVPLG